MATAVARAIEAGDDLAVEAGTGVGKTFAYLVPVLLSGRRALLSMSTQALQDQLFARDIPAVVRALGMPVRVALLKGRSNYVCLQRVEQALQGTATLGPRDPAIAAALAQVMRWATTSRAGDLAEPDLLAERVEKLLFHHNALLRGMGMANLPGVQVAATNTRYGGNNRK